MTILLVFTIISNPPISAQVNNILVNGGFENWTSGIPDNWVISSGMTVTQEQGANLLQGNSTLALAGPIGEYVQQSGSISANSDMEYNFTCEVYDEGQGAVSLNLMMIDTTSKSNVSASSPISVDNLVQNLSVMVYPQFTPNFYDVNITMEDEPKGQKKVYVDGCQLFEQTPPDIVSPNIDKTTNITLEEGITGEKVSWTVTDTSPANFTIYQNGVNVSQGNWASGTQITYSLDNLVIGLYNFTLVVQDQSDNFNNDTIFVNVVPDTTTPTINQPQDISYEVGATGNSISWKMEDANPDYYIIEKDGSVVQENSWTSGQTITIEIDGLGVGSYNYTIIANDTNGLSGKDTVLVTVTEVEETDTPSDTDTTDTSIDTTKGQETNKDQQTTSETRRSPFISLLQIKLVILLVLKVYRRMNKG